jgi:hypothetical protein
MKVLPNDGVFETPHSKKSHRLEKAGEQPFDAILKKAVDHSSKPNGPTLEPPMLDNSSGIRLDSLSPAKRDLIIKRTEGFLDILDEYQQKLSNPRSTLRDIYPLIQEMDAERERLITLSDSLPKGDGLKDILDQVLITSSIEIMKFNRGDYVDS